MNIFVPYACPLKSAQALDDKRVVKMVLETAQLLSTAMHACGGVGPYKVTHLNHPCSLWARESQGNYLWLLEHFKHLLSEYTRRYNKVHACGKLLEVLILGVDLIPSGQQTPFVNCTNFKQEADVHFAYRMCLDDKWINDKRSPTWGRQTVVYNWE